MPTAFEIRYRSTSNAFNFMMAQHGLSFNTQQFEEAYILFDRLQHVGKYGNLDMVNQLEQDLDSFIAKYNL